VRRAHFWRKTPTADARVPTRWLRWIVGLTQVLELRRNFEQIDEHLRGEAESPPGGCIIDTFITGMRSDVSDLADVIEYPAKLSCHEALGDQGLDTSNERAVVDPVMGGGGFQRSSELDGSCVGYSGIKYSYCSLVELLNVRGQMTERQDLLAGNDGDESRRVSAGCIRFDGDGACASGAGDDGPESVVARRVRRPPINRQHVHLPISETAPRAVAESVRIVPSHDSSIAALAEGSTSGDPTWRASCGARAARRRRRRPAAAPARSVPSAAGRGVIALPE
jgi:hypothetical protein